MPTCWTRNPNCSANVAMRTTSCLTSNRSCSSNCYRIKILKLYIRFCLNWKTSVNWLLTALNLSYNSPFLKCIVLQYHCCQPSLVWWPCDDHVMTMEEKPNCLLYWSSTACKWLKRLMPKWQPLSQKLYLWIISVLLEMRHSFLWVLFSSPALISLTSTEFSCYVCMYACMYVCMYVCMHACMHAYIHTCIHT